MAVIIAVAANTDGKREIVGLHIEPSETETFWATFLKSMLRRRLRGVKLVISDAHEELKPASLLLDLLLHDKGLCKRYDMPDPACDFPL